MNHLNSMYHLNSVDHLNSLVLELDKLKSVYRKSYVTNETRHENSAEHSWQLAVILLAMKDHLPSPFDFDRAMKLALFHDICEIGAGDVCTYFADENSQQAEKQYLITLQESYPQFGSDVLSCWEEYEAQNTPESKWVRLLDKLLPFFLNLATEGKTWHDQGITKSMVIAHHSFIAEIDSSIFAWMKSNIDIAVKKGWLADT